MALIRAGLLHDQARLFLDSFAPDAEGNVVCRVSDARRVSPQLVGLLQHWPEVRTTSSTLLVPPQLLAELAAVWALIPAVTAERAESEARRKTIGNRAEGYSYQLERLAAVDASAIVWVAQDDDSLGFDIEDRGVTPRRRIEVKGSSGRETRFFMSDNEWRKASDDPRSYEIHFWGGIDLNRPAADEYVALRSQGFPIVFTDLPRLIQEGVLDAFPDRWRVAAIASSV
jgi:hypothetical protein